MNQRTIPGFEPSPEAYAPAVLVLGGLRDRLARHAITAQEDIDLYVALVGGLADAQLANDPGGDRWARLLDRAIDMYLHDLGIETDSPAHIHAGRRPTMTTQTGQYRSKRDPRMPQLQRDAAMRLAATEYERVAVLFERLSPEQWSSPTDCPDWDVRAMAGHMLGMVQLMAGMPEMIRQQLTAKRRAKREGGADDRRSDGATGREECQPDHRSSWLSRCVGSPPGRSRTGDARPV